MSRLVARRRQSGLPLKAEGHMVTLRRLASLVPGVPAAITAPLASAVLSSAPSLAEPRAATVEIPFEQFTLPNGLRVLVHTDRKAPIVAVNVWYHVGSKN